VPTAVSLEGCVALLGPKTVPRVPDAVFAGIVYYTNLQMAGMPCSTASPVRRRIATVHCLGGRLPNGNGLTPRFRGFDCFCWQQTSHGAPFLSSPPAVQAKNALAMVEKTNEANDSLCRVDFDPRCEAAINEQINVEYNVSYIYHAMYTFFDRDNIALPGIAAFFKRESEEERTHAEKVISPARTRRYGHCSCACGSRFRLLQQQCPGPALF